MKINDYALIEDVRKLTEEEFNGLISYLRLMGHKVNYHLSHYQLTANAWIVAMELDSDGDLIFNRRMDDIAYIFGNQWSYEELLRIAKLGVMA